MLGRRSVPTRTRTATADPAQRDRLPDRPKLENRITDRIDLGTGNRTLAPKGRLDPTYRITYRRGLDAGG